MYKLALTAGHYMGTPGKRCLKSIDPDETREWWLNDRVADKVEELLEGYDDICVLRTDDTSGQKEIGLADRMELANGFGADFYLSIHHNAGINGGSGGGIVAYVYTAASSEAVDWQKKLYNALIAKTGLKGNRANPLGKANLYECRETNMPAVLLELGFMDSTTDTPIILTEGYADKCAEAIVETIVKEWGLVEKNIENAGGDTTNSDTNSTGSLNNATLIKLARDKDALIAKKEEIIEAFDQAINNVDDVVNTVAKLLVNK